MSLQIADSVRPRVGWPCGSHAQIIQLWGCLPVSRTSGAASSPGARRVIGPMGGSRSVSTPATSISPCDCPPQARPCRSACSAMEGLPEMGMGWRRRPKAPGTPIQPRLCQLMGERCPAVDRGRDRLPCSRRRGPRGHGRLGRSPASPAARYEQPEEPHRMTRGGLSRSRTLSSSVRPSVSSACLVSSGRLTGSADQALPLISITTCAASAPRVISQRQPRASAPARTCLPRFALICQPISPRLRQRARRQRTRRWASRAGRPRHGPGRPSGTPEPTAAPRGLGPGPYHSQ